jgi:hypothetical protein
MFQIFFPGVPYPPSRTSFEFPHISVNDGACSSSFFETPRSPLLFTFACLSSALAGTYHRLYTSDADGLSFNRLQNALLGYGGPTLIVIRPQNKDSVFGAFTASPWKEGKDFYGNTDCFLFQVKPVTAVYRPTGNSQNYMYCNSFARTRGYDNLAHGIGFGGTSDEPRLFLAENFDDNVALTQDLTFDNGPLIAGHGSKAHFLIDCLEVYGVGGDEMVSEALGAREKARGIRNEGIQRARKVDKAQFLDDFRAGVIDSKAFAHRQQIDGRADCDVADRNAKHSYDYEK